MARSKINEFTPEERLKSSLVLVSIQGDLEYLTDRELSRLVELIRLEQMDREDNKIEAYTYSGYSGDEIPVPAEKVKGEVEGTI